MEESTIVYIYSKHQNKNAENAFLKNVEKTKRNNEERRNKKLQAKNNAVKNTRRGKKW